MARRDLTETDRCYIARARKVLADAKVADLADDREMARTIGRLEAVVTQLLFIADPDSHDDGTVA